MAKSDEQFRESFEEFKNSFAYGSRTDLNFKFLKHVSTAEAADFFQALLWKLGDSFDDGQFARVREHVTQGQVQGYAGELEWKYETGPFTPLIKPVAESRLVLLTSSGHFLAGEDPMPFGISNMTQSEAVDRIQDFLKTEPILSAVPVDTPPDKLRVRHGGYDVRGVQRDPNVAFPLEMLREFRRAGIIGGLAQEAYSFVGACSQLHLLKQSGPKWVEILKRQQMDIALLVPV